MSRASPYRPGVGAAGGGGIGSPSGVSSPVPQFHQYAGRSDSEHSGSGAGPLGTPAHVHTLKKQKERSETARSVLSAMSWRFLTESTLSDREYVPPPVLTREGREYAQRVEQQRDRERAQQQQSHSHSDSAAGFATPGAAAAAASNSASPAPLHSLLTDLVSSPAHTHSAYYSPPVAPNPLRNGKSAMFESPQQGVGSPGPGPGGFRSPLSRSGSSGTLGVAGAAMVGGGSGGVPPRSPSRPFRADSPLRRQAREQAINAKSALLQRMYPVDPLLSPPGLRNPLPALPPRLTPSMLNITTETQLRDEALPMVGSDEAAVAAVPRRMEATYTELEQAIIDMAAKSIADSKAVPLPRPTPEKKQRRNTKLMQQPQQQGGGSKYSKARMQAKRAEEEKKRDQAKKRALRIDTGEEGEQATDPDLAPTTAAEEKQQQHSARASHRSARSANAQSDSSDDVSSWEEEAQRSSDSDEGDEAIEADDFAPARAKRVAAARAYHAALRSDPALAARPGGPGDSRPGPAAAPQSSSSSLIVWRESRRVQAARDVPASIAAVLLNEPTTEERMEFLQRLHRAELEEEEEQAAAAAAAAEADVGADASALADGTGASSGALQIRIDEPSASPVVALPSTHQQAAAADSAEAHLEEFKQQHEQQLDQDGQAATGAPDPTPKKKKRPRLHVVAFADGNDKMSPLSPDFVPSRPASAGGSVHPSAAAAAAAASASSGIPAESYADPRARFEAERSALLVHAARIVRNDVSFSYTTTQASKVAAARAAALAAQNEAHLEQILDAERRVGAAPVSRRRAHDTQLVREQKRRAALAAKPGFKFTADQEGGDQNAEHALAAMLASPLSPSASASAFPGGSGGGDASTGGLALLSPAAQRRAEQEARRAEAQLRREASSPGPHNPLPAFRPTHGKPLRFDSVAGSSFARAASPPREKKKLGAWYVPPSQWKVEKVLRNNEEASAAEEAERDASATLAQAAAQSLPRELQEKQSFLADSIPTLFISSVYKAHLEGIRKAQADAAAREAREAAAAEKAASYGFHRGKLPSTGAAAGALRSKQIPPGGLLTPPSASGQATPSPSLSASPSTTSFLFPLTPAPAAAAAAPADPLTHTPVRMPVYLSGLIPLDPSHPDTVIVDFAPGTNTLAAIQPPAPAGSSKKGAGTGAAGGGRFPWSAKAAPPAGDSFLSTPPNPNVAILQARAAAAAEAAAARLAGDANSPAVRLTAMTLSQQSKQREKIDRTPSPGKGAHSPERGSPSPAGRRTPSPSKSGQSPTRRAPHHSAHSVSEIIMAHQSASVAAALLRESRSASASGAAVAAQTGPLSLEDAEEQALLEAAAAHRRRATAARGGVQFAASAGSRRGSRRGSAMLASSSPSHSPTSSDGTTRVGSAASPSAAGGKPGSGSAAGAAARRARTHQPHVRLSSQHFSGQKSKAARQSVTSREADSMLIPGLEVHHHSHVFLPNITLTAAQNNKERAAANVSLLSRLHEQALEADAKAAKAAREDAASGSSADAASAGADRSGGGTGNLDLSALMSLGPQYSGQLDHRDFEADDQEYAHPLEVGMRREPRLMHFQLHRERQNAHARLSATATTAGETTQLSMRRMDDDDHDGDDGEGADHGDAPEGEGAGHDAETGGAAGIDHGHVAPRSHVDTGAGGADGSDGRDPLDGDASASAVRSSRSPPLAAPRLLVNHSVSSVSIDRADVDAPFLGPQSPTANFSSFTPPAHAVMLPQCEPDRDDGY